MPTLKNPKYELFAQALAGGESAHAAYSSAGFKANRSNAAKLAKNASIQKRVAQLLEERELIHAQATAAAVQRTGLTKSWVIDRLMENVDRARQAVPVKDSKGQPIGEFRYEGAVMNRALELLGKELGMFVDRHEIAEKTYTVSAEPTAEEWVAEHNAEVVQH